MDRDEIKREYIELKNSVLQYRMLPEANQHLLRTWASSAGNFVIAGFKLLSGIVTGSGFLCVSGLYSALLGLSKRQIIDGEKTDKNPWLLLQNIGLYILLAGAVYGVYIGRLILYPERAKRTIPIAILIALYTFVDIGLAAYTLFGKRGQWVQKPLLLGMRWIGFVSALPMIVMTQIALNAIGNENDTSAYDGRFGAVVGLVILLIGGWLTVHAHHKLMKEEGQRMNMKAAILNGYDKNGCDLVLKEIPIPEISDQEVLVKIHTAGVNPLDNMIIHGEVKMIVPYKFPLVMGNEFVGVVEKVGTSVSRYSIGDRVYGRMPLAKIGAFAEYAAIHQNAIAKVPEYLADEEAACVPLTALTALQAFELMKPKSGETIFISGGTGSLGAMAIPVAKSYGLTVITNGSAANRDRVLALGVDHFIDYKTEDYAEVLADVDFVLDTLGDRELPKEFAILKNGGKLVSLRGMPNGEFAVRTGMPAFKRMLLKFAGRKYDQMAAKKNQKYYFIFVHEDGAGLERISEIFAQRHIEASVDEVFALEDVNKALKKVAGGKSKGKTVIKINK